MNHRLIEITREEAAVLAACGADVRVSALPSSVHVDADPPVQYRRDARVVWEYYFLREPVDDNS